MRRLLNHTQALCLTNASASGIPGRFRPAVALSRHELEQRGLWDLDRLTQPFITSQLLEAALGARAREATQRFLLPHFPGCPAPDAAAVAAAAQHACGPQQRWRFRREFCSERALAHAEGLQPRPGSPSWLVEELAATQAALLTLLRNVCLLPCGDSPPGAAFHPRFGLQETSSFAQLEEWQQEALRSLAEEYFGPRQQRCWRSHARATLPALQAASGGMLLCGEDLGLVPPCVADTLSDLGVLSLRIQRMPHASLGPFAAFDAPAAYPHFCVASPSCHDVTPLRAWWAGLAAQQRAAYAAAFLPRQLGGDAARSQLANAAAGAEAAQSGPSPVRTAPGGAQPPAEATPELSSVILAQHLASPAALVVVPLQDWLALDAAHCAAVPPLSETVNDPTVKRHYWRYRMRGTLEQLAENGEWTAAVRALVEQSRRWRPHATRDSS